MRQFGNDLRNRRYRYRQFVGGVFILFLALYASPGAPGFWVGASLGTLGLLIRLWAAGHVRKNMELATDGPYAFVRHPQYLGNSLIAVGASVASGHPWAIAAWALIFWLFYVPAIRREDAKLNRRFGASWCRWAVRTPAVVPTQWPSPHSELHLGQWSLVKTLRNGEPVWTLGVTTAMVSMLGRLL